MWQTCSLPGSSVHGILQARILEWVAISSSRGSSRPRGQAHATCISISQTDSLLHCDWNLIRFGSFWKQMAWLFPLLLVTLGRRDNDLQQSGQQVSSHSSGPGAGAACRAPAVGATLGQGCWPLGESVSLWGLVWIDMAPQREATSSYQEERWHPPPCVTSAFISQFVQILAGKRAFREPDITLDWEDRRLQIRRPVRKLLWVPVKLMRTLQWESVEDTKSEGRETPRRTCRERGGREGPLSPHHEHTHTSLARSCSLWKKSQGKAHGVSLSLPLLPEDRTRRRSTGWHPAYVSYPRTRQARPTGPLLHRGPGAWYSERWCEEQSQNWS